MGTSGADVDLLICGGASDPNILSLQAAADRMGCRALSLVHSPELEPGMDWNFDTETCHVDGTELNAKGAFIRYDVFGASSRIPGELDRSYGWFSACIGLIAAIPGLRLPNARMDLRANHKSFILASARAHDIPIPKTILSNVGSTLESFQRDNDAILKPVAGGAYTRQASMEGPADIWRDGLAPMPVFMQEKLSYPEYRIFRFGDSFMTFEITSSDLDYRQHGQATLRRVDNTVLGTQTLNGLRAMSDAISVDFFACDFKTDPQTGQPLFLELNNGPMFAAFDAEADGALCEGIIRWLIGRNA